MSLCVLALTVVILGVSFGMMYRFNSAETKSHAEKYAMALLEKNVSDVSWDFKDVEHIMDAQAQLVYQQLDKPEEAMYIIEDIVSQDNIITGASVAFEPNYYRQYGAHYMLYASLDTANNLHRQRITDAAKYDYHRMPWYADAKRLGRSVWSEPYYDEGCGNRLMTTYSIPLKDKAGRVCGVLSADVSLVSLSEVINRLRTFPDDSTFVLTGSGNYVLHSSWSGASDKNIVNKAQRTDDEQLNAIGRNIVSGKSGVKQVEIGSEEVLLCYSPLKVSDWTIGYACPYNSILASLNNFTISAEGILLAVLIALVVAMWYVINYQVKPAKALTDATRHISRGEFDFELPKVKTHDEFKRLRDAFETMQLSLKQYIKELTEATEAKQRMISELNIAHDIQMSLIPAMAKDSRYPELDMSALLRPAKEVGGDFYDYLIRDGKLYFTIADVSGKGVPASLIMATVRARFRMICHTEERADRIVAELNKSLCEENNTNMFITMFVGVLNIATRALHFCNAGHNPGVIVDASGSRYMKVIANLPLGIISDFDYQPQCGELQPGSTMLFYTDGLTEAENAEHRLLGEDAVAAILNDKYMSTAAEIVSVLEQSATRFADGAEQSDDITLLCIKMNRKLEIKNELAELSRLTPFVDEVWQSMASGGEDSESKKTMLHLALEEAMVNVIEYAYPNGAEGRISLTAEYRGDKILFTLLDCGVAFDPTAAAAPDLTLSVEERPIGGLGIHLVRSIMSSVEYRRLGDVNELRMMY